MIISLVTNIPISKVLKRKRVRDCNHRNTLFYLQRGYSRIGRPCNMKPDFKSWPLHSLGDLKQPT